jgi:DNA primase small subunit
MPLRGTGKMPEEDDALVRTTRWVSKRFGQYYHGTNLHLPSRYTRREWAFLFFDKSFMIRHIGFERRSQIQDYFRKEIPRHAYYSTAYYEDPGARTMNEKGWQGATLIFDLDADHLEGAGQMEYGDMLAAVKKEFIKLVDLWLVKKMGYEHENIKVVFSGGRGYHAHIEGPGVTGLNAFERREIVDLVTGKADLSKFLEEVPYHSGMRIDGRGYSSHTFELPDPSVGDWRGDLSRETIHFFKNLDFLIRDDMRKEAAIALAEVTDKSEDEADEFLDFLEQADDAGHRRLDRLFEDRKLDFEKGLGQAFWRHLAEKLFVRMAGEADEPVTADTKRLIRLPSSLHGKTGFKVIELTREELDVFDPVIDAIAFSNDPLKIESHVDAEINLGGQTHQLEEGKVTEVTEHTAVFEFLRGMAQLPMD